MAILICMEFPAWNHVHKPGDKVHLRPEKGGVLLERVPTLAESFGKYPGDGRRWARELLEEKRAELENEIRGRTRRRRP
jgi:hypothetical protein